MVIRDYEEFAVMEPGAVMVDFRAQPFWQDVGSLDQKELSVTNVHSGPDMRIRRSDLPQNVDNEPLVFYGVSIVCGPIKVDQFFEALLVL